MKYFFRENQGSPGVVEVLFRLMGTVVIADLLPCSTACLPLLILSFPLPPAVLTCWGGGGRGVKERSINTCLLYFINRIIQLHSHMHLVKNSVHQATACKDITKTTGPVESLLLAKTQFTLDLTWSIQVIYLKKKVNPHAAMYDPEIEREEMQ